jgi:nucleoside-diphosphate-sugar epimerase
MIQKRILITGGNGFLGSNLVQYFLNQNYKVMVISRNSYNLKTVMNKIEFIQTIAEDYTSASDSIQEFSPDYVIHTAWDGGNAYSNIHCLNQFYKNLPLSLSLLEVINTLSVKPTFVGIGSFAEYGLVNTRALEDDIEHPINYYGLSKLTVKKVTELYCSLNNIKSVWIRPCYIYGPRDVPTRLISRIITGIMSNQSVKLDSCEVLIDYLHIDDFSRAVDTIIKLDLSGVYNVCSGEEHNLRDIVQFLYDNLTTGVNPKFEALPDRTSVSRYICGSNEKLKSVSNWTNTINIHDGLLNTIEYYKNHA